jgi:hypothetical protein
MAHLLHHRRGFGGVGGRWSALPLLPQPIAGVVCDEQMPSPLTGYVVTFTSFHERGFGVPTCRFMLALLHYYGVELHNFNPNSIAKAAIFITV